MYLCYVLLFVEASLFLLDLIITCKMKDIFSRTLLDTSLQDFKKVVIEICLTVNNI